MWNWKLTYLLRNQRAGGWPPFREPRSPTRLQGSMARRCLSIAEFGAEWSDAVAGGSAAEGSARDGAQAAPDSAAEDRRQWHDGGRKWSGAAERGRRGHGPARRGARQGRCTVCRRRPHIFCITTRCSTLVHVHGLLGSKWWRERQAVAAPSQAWDQAEAGRSEEARG